VRLANVRPGDVGEVDVKGRRFHALVQSCADEAGPPRRAPAGTGILPLAKGVTYRHVTAREVVAHWRRAGRQRAAL
jgi:hypothetical protein